MRHNNFFIRNTIFSSLMLFFILLGGLLGCQSKQKEPIKETGKVIIKESFKEKVAATNSENYQLLDYSCLYCHTMKDSQEKVLTMSSIRDTYKKTYTSKSEFVNAFVILTHQESKDSLLMKTNAVEQCVLMQKDAAHNQKDIEDLVGFLFDYQFE